MDGLAKWGLDLSNFAAPGLPTSAFEIAVGDIVVFRPFDRETFRFGRDVALSVRPVVRLNLEPFWYALRFVGIVFSRLGGRTPDCSLEVLYR